MAQVAACFGTTAARESPYIACSNNKGGFMSVLFLNGVLRAWAASAFLVTSVVCAQSYPTKPISLIVGYAAGGSVDLAARTIAPELSKRLGQPIIVDNVTGAGGSIGTQKVISAAADGYTLLLGTSAEIAVAKLVSPIVRYDGLSDLTALGLIGTQPMVIVENTNLKAKNVADFIGHLRAHPARYAYGSAGNGSLPHLAGELFRSRTRTEMVHVPYKGAAPMITELLGGTLDTGVLVLSSALPQIKAGKLKAIAVTEPSRAAQLPDVPALAESKELSGFDISVFFAVFARSEVPAPVRERVTKELTEILKLPEVRSKLGDSGFTVRALDAAAATAFIKRQALTYREIVEQSKIRE
jgi:tripartite-type tricarboxylate transporter receptor subunit TctC